MTKTTSNLSIFKAKNLLSFPECQPRPLSLEAEVRRVFIAKIATMKPGERMPKRSILFPDLDRKKASAISNARRDLNDCGLIISGIVNDFGITTAKRALEIWPQIEAERWINDLKRLPDQTRRKIRTAFLENFPDIDEQTAAPIKLSELDKKDASQDLAFRMTSPAREKELVALVYLLQFIADKESGENTSIPIWSIIRSETGISDTSLSRVIRYLLAEGFIEKEEVKSQPNRISNGGPEKAQAILAPFYQFEADRIMESITTKEEEM